MLRGLLAAAGVAALAWGVWLAWDFAGAHDAIQVVFWLAGGPVVHDGVVAPVVGVVGLAVVRFVPPVWRAPVAVGAVLSGVLALLAVPLLWHPFGVATNPGLHDGDYAVRLSITLGVVWLGVAVAGIVRARRRSRVPS